MRANATAIDVPSSIRSVLCDGERRSAGTASWAVSATNAPSYPSCLERRRPRADARRTIRRAVRRSACHVRLPSRRRGDVTGVRVSVTPRRYCPRNELRTPVVPVAERLLVLQGVPARVPLLLPRATARAALAWTTKGTLVHRALELLLDRPSDERTLDAGLADLDAARIELATHPDFTDLDAHRRGVGGSSTPTRSCSSAATSSSRTRSAVRPIGLELKLEADLGTVAPPRRDRPARARRRRRARRHRLQDRLGPERAVGGEEPERRPHVRAAVRAHVRQAPGARAALLPLASPRRSSPRRAISRSPAVERKTVAMWSAIATACERDDFRPHPGGCATSARSSRTAPPTAATRSTPPSCAVPGTVIAPTLPLVTA